MVAVARELPNTGYALEVDGRLKTQFETKEGAWTGAEELKKRFPMRKSGDFRAEYEGSVPFTCIFVASKLLMRARWIIARRSDQFCRPSGDVVESLEDVNTGRLPQMGGASCIALSSNVGQRHLSSLNVSYV